MVVITAYVSDPLLNTMSRLRQAGRRLALVALTEEPPAPRPGIVTYHLARVETWDRPEWLGSERPVEKAATQTRLALKRVPDPAGSGTRI
jgi:hypothetical protein